MIRSTSGCRGWAAQSGSICSPSGGRAARRRRRRRREAVPVAVFYEALRLVWCSAEFLYRYDEVWDDLWWLESSRFEREPARRCELMSPEEMQMYEALPTPVRIYRGYGEWTSEDYDPSEMWQGYSWTLDRDRAVRFAKRFTVLHGAPRIASATISREHIVALFEERNESELIVLPKHIVGHVQIRPLGL
jgi:hypothetical protein